MLKITADTDTRRFVLAGSLAGPWVDTLDENWRGALAHYEPQQISIDLSDVTFVDARGKQLLTAMHKAGTALVAAGCMNSALIRDIEDENRAPIARGGSRSAAWLLAVLVPSLAILTACSNVRAQSQPGRASGRPAVTVDIAPVVSGGLAQTVDVVGSLAVKFSADVKSELSGTVSAVYVTEWVPVRAGARLARLNTTETEAAVEAIRAAEAQARVAETRSRREYARALQLKEYGLITSQAVEDARSALEASEATTAAASAQVRAGEARLAKSFITAPISGTVALRRVNVGDRVDNIGGDAPLFRIVDNRRLDLTVSVPSAQLGDVRLGQPLEFGVDALPGRTFTGKVMFINPAVDEASRAVKVVAEVPNDDGALKGGLFVKGRIIVSNSPAVLQVPRAALVRWDVTAETADVFVVRDGKAEKRAVRTGPAVGATVAIETGLTSGEQVVTRGGFQLKAGDRVTVSGTGV